MQQRKLVPALVDGMFAKQLEQDHFGRAPAESTPGKLWEPIAEGTGASRGWQTTPRRLLSALRR